MSTPTPIKMIETAPGQFIITDGQRAIFTNVTNQITVETMMLMVATLDLDFGQMGFVATVLCAGPPKCDLAAKVMNFDVVPLCPAGVKLTTPEVGHG